MISGGPAPLLEQGRQLHNVFYRHTKRTEDRQDDYADEQRNRPSQFDLARPLGAVRLLGMDFNVDGISFLAHGYAAFP